MSIKDTVVHCINEHPNEQLSILRQFKENERIKHRAMHFNIACNDVHCDAEEISVDSNYVLHIPEQAVSASPPVKKRPKVSTPHKRVNMGQRPGNLYMYLKALSY